jgi:hypothetical protein
MVVLPHNHPQLAAAARYSLRTITARPIRTAVRPAGCSPP